MGNTNSAYYSEIKQLVIKAFFADDYLKELFTLKGGNALDLVYKINGRSSLDIDLSMVESINEANLESIKERIITSLNSTFATIECKIFDFSFTKRPPVTSSDLSDFWGGYRCEFKIIKTEKLDKLGLNIEQTRRNTESIGLGSKKIFSIDISCFEHCSSRVEKDFDNIKIYVYSPEMIVFEKLRAICQSMPEYRETVKSVSGGSRAKDFYDIWKIIDFFDNREELLKNTKILSTIFSAKRVPIDLLLNILERKEDHRDSFISVKDTVNNPEQLQTFDYYAMFVYRLSKELHARHIE